MVFEPAGRRTKSIPKAGNRELGALEYHGLAVAVHQKLGPYCQSCSVGRSWGLLIGSPALAGTFDPSLLLVMGGALLVSLPAFQAILRSSSVQRPVCAPSFDLPSKSRVDQQLVVGALIFGAGGFCMPRLNLIGGCSYLGFWPGCGIAAAMLRVFARANGTPQWL